MPPKRKAILSRYLLKSQILKAAKRRIQEGVSSMRLLLSLLRIDQFTLVLVFTT